MTKSSDSSHLLEVSKLRGVMSAVISNISVEIKSPDTLELLIVGAADVKIKQ